MNKLLNNKKGIISFIAALTIFISAFGYNAFAASNSKTKVSISDKQATQISAKAFTAFAKLFDIGQPDKMIEIDERTYGKLAVKFKDSKAFYSYVDKKTKLGSYYSKDFKNKILNFITVVYRGNYYVLIGDPEIGIYDLANAKVESKKYSKNTVQVTLKGNSAEGEYGTSKVTFTLVKGKWLVSSWKDISEGLGM